jgi:hypothetical protein
MTIGARVDLSRGWYDASFPPFRRAAAIVVPEISGNNP